MTAIQSGKLALSPAPAQPEEISGFETIQTLNGADDLKKKRPVPMTPSFALTAAAAKVVQATPTVAVFPVMLHGSREKAFYDLPIILSTAFASQLTDQFRRTGLGYVVLNPLYTYDALRAKGLELRYQKMIRDYMEAGQPNETDLTLLADQLSTEKQHVRWAMFVEAEFDTNQITQPFGRLEKALSYLLDQAPNEPNYLIKSIVQLYSTEDGIPLVWQQNGTGRIPGMGFGNFSKSVYDDSDSTLNFRLTANQLAKTMLKKLPQATPFVDASVKGAISAEPGPDPLKLLPVEAPAGP